MHMTCGYAFYYGSPRDEVKVQGVSTLRVCKGYMWHKYKFIQQDNVRDLNIDNNCSSIYLYKAPEILDYHKVGIC